MVWTGTAVIPTTFQTDRQDIHALVIAIADGWITYCQTNAIAEGIVRARWHVLPETLDGEGPFVYLSEITERITHDMQTRTTVFEGGVGYVDTYGDPEEVDDRINAFSDYMRDVFTYNAQTMDSGHGVFEEYEAADANPLHEGPYPYPHFMIRWRYVVQGGYR
jgi:hypothetical protein